MKKNILKEGSGDLYVTAGIFVGMGLGFLFDQLVAGLFIGLGIGYAAMAISRSKK